MKLKTRIINAITLFVSKLMGGVAQDESNEEMDGVVTEGMPEIVREAASEGAVLLKNDNNLLPLKEKQVVSVFGRTQLDYFYTGYGSGGDVRKPYIVNILDGIRHSELELNEELASIYSNWCKKYEVDHGFWGHWPRSHPEMKLTEEVVSLAKSKSDVAVVVIGRSSGEDRENALIEGSYYLKKDERQMLDMVTSKFDKVVVLLNIGSIMDMSWIEEYKISSVLIVWQGGMESGNAIADLLSGKVCPSGRLSDTIAKSYKDYPSSNDFGAKKYNNYVEDIYVGYRYFETFKKDRVLYPFGYGMSYTTFEQNLIEVKKVKDKINFKVKITNTGDKKGKQVCQVYLQKPQGNIGNPYRELVGYEKTRLLDPKDSEIIDISVDKYQMTSYDDSGLSGNKSCYILNAGDYIFSIGDNVKDAIDVYTYSQEKLEVYQKLSEVMAPKKPFRIITTANKDGKIVESYKMTPVVTTNLKQIILNNLPKEIPYSGDKGIKLIDVKEKRATIDEFIAQLNEDELEAISRGDYTMDSPLGARGNAGALGGTSESLRSKGVPAMITTDGPSGIRLFTSCSLIPIGTALACSFNKDLVYRLHKKVGAEMVDKGSDILLAPGINIHRNPLCGRNFEYYSEDPFLTGTIASSAVKGIQENGVSACPKHFACNNQEYKRTTNDSRCSERALREIYLKGFEICIKEANPLNIMTSYNKINGVWNHYNYELCDTVLRKEWGYENNVMTDWWMQYSSSPEFSNLKDHAYRVRSRVDVFMPGDKRMGKKKPDGTLLATYGQKDGITLGEMQTVARDVLTSILNSNKQL